MESDELVPSDMFLNTEGNASGLCKMRRIASSKAALNRIALLFL